MSGSRPNIFLKSNDAAEYVVLAQEGPWEFRGERLQDKWVSKFLITVPFPKFGRLGCGMSQGKSTLISCAHQKKGRTVSEVLLPVL